MNRLLLAIVLMLSNSGTDAQESSARRDPGGSLPPVRRLEVDTMMMSPAERATIACLQATNKVMAFSRGRVVKITIGLPDADLLEILDVATKSIGRAAPSARTEAPPTPQLPIGDVTYEAVRRLLSPSGDWSAKTFSHLDRLKGQVARLVAVGQAAQQLIAASPHFTKAAEVTDRPWPDQRSIILYLDRPEQCQNPLLGDYFEATVAYVRERIESLDILDSVAQILLAVDTRVQSVHPLSALSFDEACGGRDGIGTDGVVCGFSFHRVLFPFYADAEDEAGPSRVSGEAQRNIQQFNSLIGKAGDVAGERREAFLAHARSDAEAVLPKLLALVSLFEGENVALTTFRKSLDEETLAVEKMAQEITLGRNRLAEIAREIATLDTDLTAVQVRLDGLDQQRTAARDDFDGARKVLDEARAALSRLGSTCEEAGIADCGNPVVREDYNRRKHDAYQSVNTALNSYIDLQKRLLEQNEQYFDARQKKSDLLTARGSLLAERSVADIRVQSLEREHARRTAMLRTNENRYAYLWPAHVADMSSLEKALALSRELANP
ncbi:hypothetical protein [Bradyrhizobium sp. LMTR 3]|uniref:hypothetical protein n=1 Tax=Bradyrhizobium sp. LMTR 3 TaxID=189873 RepID=UPI0008106F09|nr:hypothetical protein [Bradyrhizobium sp. LMTR 3]OCK55062.1 hypothetical protein LMTR3_09860 [Bradyrhizobium sp. LMTR 3]